MKWHELPQSIQKRGLGPLYLVLGEEDYLRDEAEATLKQAVIGGDGLGGFNYDLFYGDECVASDILSCARDLPIFADRRVVFVKTIEKLPAREAEELIPYLKDPCTSTTLVFVSPKLDGRLKFSQALKERAALVDCGPLPGGQVPGWIRNQASQLGLRLSDDAVAMLAELASQSLSLVKRELEKLASSVPEGAIAGPAEVEMLRGTEPGASVFDLSSAIGTGDRSRALRILARNLEAGEAPLRILGALVWQYRRLWRARTLLVAGGSEAEIGRAIGVPPFRLRDFVAQVRLFSESAIRRAFKLFLEADSALKGGSATVPERNLELLVLRLCPVKDTAASVEAQAHAPSPTPQTPPVRKTKPIRTVRTIRSGQPRSR